MKDLQRSDSQPSVSNQNLGHDDQEERIEDEATQPVDAAMDTTDDIEVTICELLTCLNRYIFQRYCMYAQDLK